MADDVDLFGHGPAQGSLFGDGERSLASPRSPLRARSREGSRQRLTALLEKARSAERMPWSEREARMWQTVFPNMANWLPDHEAAQLRLEFAQEMERLRAGQPPNPRLGRLVRVRSKISADALRPGCRPRPGGLRRASAACRPLIGESANPSAAGSKCAWAERLPARHTATIGRSCASSPTRVASSPSGIEDRAADMAERPGEFVRLAHVEDLHRAAQCSEPVRIDLPHPGETVAQRRPVGSAQRVRSRPRAGRSGDWPAPRHRSSWGARDADCSCSR